MKTLQLSLIILVLTTFTCFSQDSPVFRSGSAEINPVDYSCLITDIMAQAAFMTNEAEITAVKLAPGEVTYSEENEYGKEVYDELVKSNTFINTGADKEKLDRILTKLVAARPSAKTSINYTIYLLDDTLVNAFTAGGYIYVYKEMMDYCNSEDELAFIIAHEIGHNELGHINLILKRLKVAGQFGDILYTVKELTTRSFNQFNELEADCYGADLVKATAYNPVDGAKFWKKMAEDYDETDFKFLKFFMTHPYSRERYECLKKHIEKYFGMTF